MARKLSSQYWATGNDTASTEQHSIQVAQSLARSHAIRGLDPSVGVNLAKRQARDPQAREKAIAAYWTEYRNQCAVELAVQAFAA